jgi:RNA polymerase sigma-70 factor (ECF subfamily)
MMSSTKTTMDSDADRLLAVAAGDRLAFDQLYFAYHRRLAQFLFRFTPRYENVEEIINDTTPPH